MVLFVVTWQGIWIGKVAERAMLTCSAGNLGMLSVSRIRVFFPSYREKACSGSCMMASWTGFCSKLIMQKACKGNKRSAVWCKLHGLGNVEKNMPASECGIGGKMPKHIIGAKMANVGQASSAGQYVWLLVRRFEVYYLESRQVRTLPTRGVSPHGET